MLKNILEKLRSLLGEFDLSANILYYIGTNDALPSPLEQEEENSLVERMDKGDESVKSALIEHNLRLVVYIARRFDNSGVDLDDLISVGTIGLIKAVNSFNSDKNIKLATYSSRCIENEILMYFRRTKKLQGEVSLNEAIETDGDGAELSIGDVVGKSDTMLEDLQDKDDRALVRRLVAERLTEREADVIRRRYGLEGRVPQTQRQVAAAYKISRSYVSRIEKKALGKLEEALREYW